MKAKKKKVTNCESCEFFDYNEDTDQYECTVDGVHPNDFGFVRMAETIGAIVRHALENNKTV